jgi:hypothetical protein
MLSIHRFYVDVQYTQVLSWCSEYTGFKGCSVYTGFKLMFSKDRIFVYTHVLSWCSVYTGSKGCSVYTGFLFIHRF